MTDRPYILKRLILPLSLASAASLAGGFFLKGLWHDLLVNLTATFVGSILTVAYIDQVLQRRREIAWEGMRSRAAMRLFALANSFITSVRIALKVGSAVVDGDEEQTEDPRVLRTRMIHLAGEILPPVSSRIRNMSTPDWLAFYRSLYAAYEIADRLLGLFGKDFPPRIAELVLDIQTVSQNATFPYVVFPDLVGIPAEQLPHQKDLSIQDNAYKLTELAVLRLLNLCTELLKLLEDLPSKFDA